MGDATDGITRVGDGPEPRDVKRGRQRRAASPTALGRDGFCGGVTVSKKKMENPENSLVDVTLWNVMGRALCAPAVRSRILGVAAGR